MYGTLYLIPCPISDETAPWDVLPAANRAVMDSLDYFIVENTRSARRFLSKAGIARPIDTLEFRELNEHTVAGREERKAGGAYIDVTGKVKKVDDFERLIVMQNGTKMPMDDILNIEGEIFASL